MRPQHITAENGASAGGASAGGSASMRPQHITAENPALSARTDVAVIGFNEAAAYHCGKLQLAPTAPCGGGTLQ